jgi:hypothetical protein
LAAPAPAAVRLAGDAAEAAAGLIVLPARADQVAAHHRLDRQRLESAHDHGAAFEQRQIGCIARGTLERLTGQMVGDDRSGAREPEARDLIEHAAFAGNGIGQYDIEGRQAIGGDDQQALRVERIDIAHLAAMQALQTFEIRTRRLRCAQAYRVSWPRLATIPGA